MVVLDVNMPTGSGLSVCEMMASDEKLRMVPVIILTGCSDEKTIRRCHDMLVFYVQKGTDVWSRIDPLVRELLHLDEMPMPLEPMASDDSIAAAPQPAPTAAPETESLLDAVFEMLGAERTMADRTMADRAMHGGGEVLGGSSRERVHMPWILCIDDDFDYSDALKIRFDEYGVAVARAANGMSGYRMAFSTPASAILLDYQMPNGQGDYILDRLKSNPITRDLPVFMITGVKDKMLERRVMAMGAAGYLLKPVDFNNLCMQLSRYIDVLRLPARRMMAAAT
jgi:response regulator RpfG family c-di-GMP phosphodiesterase